MRMLALCRPASADYSAWRTLTRPGSTVMMPDRDDWVVLSPPRRPYREWRCVIVGGEVVAAGCYMEEGNVRPSEISAPPSVWRWAAEVAEVWLPDETCVMDLAEDASGKLRVLEFNCIHASGFYGLDRGVIARAIALTWK
jgi:hypothetical protein